MTTAPTPEEKKASPLLAFLHEKTREELAAIATEAKTSIGNLWQVAYGHGACSSAKARDIAAATAWEVTPHQIAPKHFPYPLDGLPPEKRAVA